MDRTGYAYGRSFAYDDAWAQASAVLAMEKDSLLVHDGYEGSRTAEDHHEDRCRACAAVAWANSVMGLT